MITKEEFTEYEKIRNSGKTNMFDINMVIKLSKGKLTKEKIIEIMENYDYWIEKYTIKHFKN